MYFSSRKFYYANMSDEELENHPVKDIVPNSDWEEAREERGASGAMLSKEGVMDENIPQELKEKFSSLGNEARLQGHIKRLLEPNRTTEEQAFGITFLRNFEDHRRLFEQIGIDDPDSSYNMIRLVVGEGNSTTTWWTLAPYIFSRLIKKLGGDEEKAFAYTLKYAILPAEFDESDFEIWLAGLDYHNRGWKTRTFTLTKNHEGKSHQIARKIADALVDLKYVG